MKITFSAETTKEIITNYFQDSLDMNVNVHFIPQNADEKQNMRIFVCGKLIVSNDIQNYQEYLSTHRLTEIFSSELSKQGFELTKLTLLKPRTTIHKKPNGIQKTDISFRGVEVNVFKQEKQINRSKKRI